MAKKLVIILENIRSAQNVGAIFRTAEGLGIDKIFLTGITPFPQIVNDPRLPHISQKATKMIAKTALGAEKTLPFSYEMGIGSTIKELKNSGYKIYALEQSKDSVLLDSFKPVFPCALIVGHEIDGVSSKTLSLVDKTIEIPMQGKKESFNVSAAMAIAAYAMLR